MSMFSCQVLIFHYARQEGEKWILNEIVRYNDNINERIRTCYIFIIIAAFKTYFRVLHRNCNI